MAMLPMKQGMRRAVLYGGEEKGRQVITVSQITVSYNIEFCLCLEIV